MTVGQPALGDSSGSSVLASPAFARLVTGQRRAEDPVDLGIFDDGPRREPGPQVPRLLAEGASLISW